MSARELDALLSVSEPIITLLANAAAFIFEQFDRLNWAGFYLLRGETLHLGPFIGKPACTVLHLGKGVCAASVVKRATVVVPDVEQFEGHVACDAGSRSEIVLPIILRNGSLVGVLDLDSPEVDRFDESSRVELEALRDVIATKLDAMRVSEYFV